MPRNGSGSYTLPEAPFVPQTPISSSAVNSDLSDIASALTGSLARDGQGGMTSTLPLANSGLSYSSDPNTGLHRTGADEQAIQCGGTDIVTVGTDGAEVDGDLNVTGNITRNGASIIPVGLGPLPWSGLTAPTGWVLANGSNLLRADYPDLWAFAQAEIAGGNTLYTNGNGTTTFAVPDMRGRVPAGDDNMGGGVGAGRLTSTTMTPDGQTLGAVNNTDNGQTVTLTSAQIPSITSANASQSISVALTNFVIINGSGILSSATGGGSEATFSIAGGAQVSKATSTGTNSISVTSNNTGGAASPNVQPTIITNYIIYAGV